MEIKLLIAEDHDFTRQGLVFGLKRQGYEIIAETDNGKQAVEIAKQKDPHLVVMDIGMPLLDGIEATKEIKKSNPNTKVLILTSHKEKQNVLNAFNSGADAYCVKNIDIENLANVIEMVCNGAVWIDPSIANFILDTFKTNDFVKNNSDQIKKEKTNQFKLTAREIEILKLISEGMNNKELAEKLFLSMSTVKNHVSSIINKLSVNDRTQAVLVALKENLV